MKALAIALCLAATGCAGTTPQDVMTEFSHWLNRASLTYDAIDRAYMALCFERESAPECVDLNIQRETVKALQNSIIDKYNELSAKLSK